jgi:hypothetical protein
MSERRAVFFPHNRDADVREKMGPPGRVPYHVMAQLVDGQSTKPTDVVIFGDGYCEDTPGPNQDPCIFSERAPVHTFCRIGTDKPKHHVHGTTQILSQFAEPGDVIVYGNFEPPSNPSWIWVDTVLVVRDTVPLATSPRSSVCGHPACDSPHPLWRADPIGLARELTGAADGASTAAYRYNLRDGGHDGTHCCTPLDDYLILRGETDPTPQAVGQLSTSFVPLAVHRDGSWELPMVRLTDLGDHGEELRAFWATSINDSEQADRIAAFPRFELARSLLDAIRQRSGAGQGLDGAVAIPPLVPLRVKRRWDPWQLRTVPESE